MNIYLGADHAGFQLKEEIKKYLNEEGIKFTDIGNERFDPNDDYPDFGFEVARSVQKDKGSKGIVICGSSFGVCIAANKVKGIRAVSVQTEKEAKLSREHNDANILCLSGGQIQNKIEDLGIDPAKAISIIKVWLDTEFSNEERHRRRVEKINDYTHS